jgi:hypothetical protein
MGYTTMKTFNQFIENTRTNFDDFTERERIKKERQKEQEQMKQDITRDVLARVERKDKITRNTPNPYAN